MSETAKHSPFICLGSSLLFTQTLQKCDGIHPSCTPCQNSVQFNDCEYASSGATQSQLLEERIAKLKMRVAELEARSPSTHLLSSASSPSSNRSAQKPTSPEVIILILFSISSLSLDYQVFGVSLTDEVRRRL